MKPELPCFAYGANLDRDSMRRRAPGAEFLGMAILHDWDIFIARSGWASIAPSPGAVVYGVLWTLSSDDRARLDDYEGVRDGLYGTAEVTVSAGGNPVESWCYVEREGGRGSPQPAYLDRIIAAANALGFPDEYVDRLRRLG